MNVKTCSRRPIRGGASGFTVVELLVVLAIGATLAAIAAPSFTSTLAKYRVGAESSALLDSLLLVRNSVPVTICASTDGRSCTNTAWEAGYIVFRDPTGIATVDAGEEVLNYTPAAKPGITITATLQQAGTPFVRPYLHFGTDGKMDLTTAILFTTCKPGTQGVLTVIRTNGSTSSNLMPGVCP
jgi:type IV fimbrial biogenesis protein FimT